MTSLLAYLTAHNIGPVMIAHAHQTHLYALLSHYCRSHGELTAWAKYGHGSVMYCYSNK